MLEQGAGEKRGLFPAGSGADFKEDVFLVVGVFGQEGGLQVGVQAASGAAASASRSCLAISSISGSFSLKQSIFSLLELGEGGLVLAE